MSAPVIEDAPGRSTHELALTVFLMLIGVGVAIGGWSYGVGTIASPASGFVPLVIGLTMTLLATSLLAQELRRTPAIEAPDTNEKLAPAGHVSESEGPLERPSSRLNAPLSILACIASFAFVLLATDAFGLLVTASIIVGVLAFVMRTSWWAAILLGGGFYGLSYAVFAVWLAIPLPFGSITGG